MATETILGRAFNYASYFSKKTDTSDLELADFVTLNGVQTLTNKTIILPQNAGTNAHLRLTAGGTPTTTPINGDIQYTSTAPLFTNNSGTGVLAPLFMTLLTSPEPMASGFPFPADQNSLSIAPGFYSFDFFLFGDNLVGVTPRNYFLSFATSGTTELIRYWTEGSSADTFNFQPAASGTFGTDFTSLEINMGPPTTGRYVMIKGSGYFSFTSVGTFAPIITVVNNQTGASWQVGSFFKVWPISNTLNAKIGPWT